MCLRLFGNPLDESEINLNEVSEYRFIMPTVILLLTNI